MPSIQGKLWQAVALPVYLNVTAVWQTDQDALVVVSPGMIGAYDAVADDTKVLSSNGVPRCLHTLDSALSWPSCPRKTAMGSPASFNAQ